MTFVNVATPLTAVTVVVPTRRPPVGALARLNVILSDEDVMVFPSASWTATRIGGEIVNPASTVAGSPVKNARFDGTGANRCKVRGNTCPDCDTNRTLPEEERPAEALYRINCIE